MVRILTKKVSMCKKVLHKLKSILFYSYPIRYIITSFLNLFSIFFTFFIVNLTSGKNTGIKILCGVFTLAQMCWPLFVVGFLVWNHAKLQSLSFKARFGAMYRGIRTNSFQSMIYESVFAVKRINLVFTSIFFTINSPLSSVNRNFYTEKILMFLAIQTCYLSYIHLSKPHD